MEIAAERRLENKVCSLDMRHAAWMRRTLDSFDEMWPLETYTRQHDCMRVAAVLTRHLRWLLIVRWSLTTQTLCLRKRVL